MHLMLDTIRDAIRDAVGGVRLERGDQRRSKERRRGQRPEAFKERRRGHTSAPSSRRISILATVRSDSTELTSAHNDANPSGALMKRARRKFSG
jgi:hypothetical protein